MMEGFKRMFNTTPKATPDREDVLRRLEQPSGVSPEIDPPKPKVVEEVVENPRLVALKEELAALKIDEARILEPADNGPGQAGVYGNLDELAGKIKAKEAEIGLFEQR